MSDTHQGSETSGTDSGALIFVVDDEPMLLELASLVLEPLGYTIRTFRDPKTALEQYQQAQPPPSVIITDYAMHQMNGMELINECKRINPLQKIIMVSGTVSEEIYHDAPVKPDHFLAKPYQAAHLTSLVASLVKNA